MNDDKENDDNEKTPERDRPDDEQPRVSPDVRVRLSPALQEQMMAASKAISNAATLPIQRALRDLAIAQQAPIRDAMRTISAAQHAKLLEGVQAIGRVYSAPLAEAVKSFGVVQNRALAESINSLGTFRLAPQISEALGKQFGKHLALQFPKIDLTGFQKAFASPAFIDAKKLLGSLDMKLPRIDPAIFGSFATRARLDLDRATAWVEPAADDAAERGEGIQAALDDIVTTVKDLTEEIRTGRAEQRVRDAINAKREVLLTLLAVLISIVMGLATSQCEKPVTVEPVIVIEEKSPDPTLPSGTPSVTKKSGTAPRNAGAGTPDPRRP